MHSNTKIKLKSKVDFNETHSNTKIKLKSKVDFNETHSKTKNEDAYQHSTEKTGRG
jgi:hypothetical protein